MTVCTCTRMYMKSLHVHDAYMWNALERGALAARMDIQLYSEVANRVPYISRA